MIGIPISDLRNSDEIAPLFHSDLFRSYIKQRTKANRAVERVEPIGGTTAGHSAKFFSLVYDLEVRIWVYQLFLLF